MTRETMRVAEISSNAIRDNVARIRELTGCAVIAVVKADGYGHGAEASARAALRGGATMLGVTDITEALQLRDAGIDAPILCWLHAAAEDFVSAVAAGVDIGVSRIEQLEAIAIAAAQAGVTAVVQFKVDTGLSRNGVAPGDLPRLFARGAQLQRDGLVHIRGIFSHLANAGAEADLAQAERFDAAVSLLREAEVEPEMIHLAASAATLTSPLLHYNTVRVGVAIYGLSPFEDRSSAELGLRPAMTLRSELVMLRDVPTGSGISYGHTHIVDTDARLGLVPIGYADGVPRVLSGTEMPVVIAGERAPIVGRVGMDQCVVDLTRLTRAASIGDPVTLFGDPETGAVSIDDWARRAGTINYEIAVGIGARVTRVTTGAEEELVRKIEISDPDAMHEFGCSLGAMLRAGDLLILTGALGAGKTTLTRGIGEGLGVRGPVTSPTFVLARTHPSLSDGPSLVHVDAYRLADASEVDDLDLDFEGSVVVAEWGAGLIAESGSWLEIVIDRPDGASDLDSSSGDALGEAPTRSEAGDLLDLAEELIEPRIVTLTGHGSRWQDSELFS